MAASSICSCSSIRCTTPAASTVRKPAGSLSSSSSLASSSSSFRSSFQVQARRQRRNSSYAPGGRCGDERRFRFRVNANLDEWGARDPTAQEIESNFGDKVLGFEGTDHIILIPPSLLGLSERSCTPLAADAVPLPEQEAKALLRKVVGWRLSTTENGLKIWTEWKLKDSEAATTLFDRIRAVAEAEDQHPELHVKEENIAVAQVSTQSVGGLTINDFIFAAKIDKVKTSDLVKKNRFWA